WDRLTVKMNAVCPPRALTWVTSLMLSIPLGTARSSSASSRGQKLVRWPGNVCLPRRGAGAEVLQFRSQVENDMKCLLSRAGLRYKEDPIVAGGRPSAGAVPGRWGLAWR